MAAISSPSASTSARLCAKSQQAQSAIAPTPQCSMVERAQAFIRENYQTRVSLSKVAARRVALFAQLQAPAPQGALPIAVAAGKADLEAGDGLQILGTALEPAQLAAPRRDPVSSAAVAHGNRTLRAGLTSPDANCATRDLRPSPGL